MGVELACIRLSSSLCFLDLPLHALVFKMGRWSAHVRMRIDASVQLVTLVLRAF